MNKKETEVKELENRLDKIALMLEKAKLGDYVSMMSKPKSMIFGNFIAGLARGFGSGYRFYLAWCYSDLFSKAVSVFEYTYNR